MPPAKKQKPLILVTGSSGLIGKCLTEALRDDYQIIGLDINAPDSAVVGAEWMECDLTSDESVSDVMARIREECGGKVASVVHLAAYYDFTGEPSPMYDKLTVEGTRRLLNGLKSFDQVEHFVFSSSLLVMKPIETAERKLTEASPTQAEWDYPQSKLETERLLEEEHGDIPLVILRLAGVYDEDCNSLPISQHIRRIFEKQAESYVFPGDAECGQPFVHLDDVIKCFRKTIEKRGNLEEKELFLIAEPDLMSYRQLQETLGTLIHGKMWPTVRIPKTVARSGAWMKEKLPGLESFIKPWMIDLADDHYPVEIKRARERLDWSPTMRLSDTLPTMIERLMRDPREWYETNNLPVPDGVKELAGTKP